MWSRRDICTTAAALAVAGCQHRPVQTAKPSERDLQSGDLLWPKPPGAWVPYVVGVNVTPGAAVTPGADQAAWEAEKRRFLQAPVRDGHLSGSDVQNLEDMSYKEFRRSYGQEAAPPGTPGAGFYVGHVAIVHAPPGDSVEVVEAVRRDDANGVVRATYADWIAKRADQLVWHGRIRDLEPEQRSKISVEALKHLGKPFSFFNFDLNDDAGFYCSKLVWLATWRALNVALDGVAEPKRALWFSPKQLINLRRIQRLTNPGPYYV